MKRLVVILAAVAMVAGCGHPLIPRSALESAPSSTRPSARAASSQPLRTPFLGVDLYALTNLPAAQVRADGQRTLAYISHVLKANAVGIVWNFYAASDRANSVEVTNATLSAANVAILTKIAQSDHLEVEYRPLIMVPSNVNHWEGFIRPTGPVRWFDNYFSAELPYLRTAQQLGVSEFVTATEMHGLNTSPLWPAFFARVSRVYRGVVSYTAWDNDYFRPLTHLLPSPDLGMDMYRRLALPPGATQSQVTAAWAALFSRMPAGVLRRTAIDETGIQARSGAYTDPANLRVPGLLQEGVQASWYTAACQTVRQFHLRGVFFWKVDLTDFPDHPAASLSTFEGKEGAAAIRACATILH